MENPFVLAPEAYKRDLDILKHYVNDSATYLQLSTGKPFEQCKQFIADQLKPTGEFAFKDPKIKYLLRGDNGDREEVESTLYTFLREVITNKEIIAPTLTTYVHPDVCKSFLAIFVKENIRARGIAKKQMFAAKAAGDELLAAVKKVEQTNKKLSNNAISGAHVSPSNPLYNKTAHSTLTSGCRVTSANGNANNEKLLSGNRHYWSHHIVLNNIISTINNVDYELMDKTIAHFNLAYPTVEETLACIKYSTDLYWWESTYFKLIEDLVNKLNPLQRAAFVYVGDLYHLMKYNQSFFREFLDKLSKKVYIPKGDPDEIIKNGSDNVINLAHQICTEETKGIGKDHGKIKGTPKYDTLAATIQNINETIDEYSSVIRSFLVTSNSPASVAYFPESIRRAALTSDTDSTIFTVQDWVFWYKNDRVYDDTAIAACAAMVFLASSSITHILATMSANFGVVTEDIHRIEMKSEFRFDCFVPSQLGKHYFARIGCQEGNVFEHYETEIKGVMLKSSNLPKQLNKKALEMMEEIMDTALQGKQISMKHFLTQVAKVETDIIDSIRKGEYIYLRKGSIKDAGSYTKEQEDSPYQNHQFWNKTFGTKYGEMPNPPYETVKVSLITDTPTGLKAWLANMVDKDLSMNLTRYFEGRGKKTLTTLHMPLQILEQRGFPPEFVEIINYRQIVIDLCKVFYIILECIGFYTCEDKVQRLVSDMMK